MAWAVSCLRGGRWIPSRGDAVIMLSVRGGEADRIVGLEMGADDYLTMPFSSYELLARIRSVLRRSHVPLATRVAARRPVLTFASWRLDRAMRRLYSTGGERVPLTCGEFELLVAFCEHPNRVLTRAELLREYRASVAHHLIGSPMTSGSTGESTDRCKPAVSVSESVRV
jgi:DNA-binding response OmpR family regulator